jgi:hypothetical protein
LKANDQRLFVALGEVGRTCRSHNPPLPVLTSIIVRRAQDGTLGTPGTGYYAEYFPHVREESARLQIWREEVARVAGFAYPEQLTSDAVSLPSTPRLEVRRVAGFAYPEQLTSVQVPRPSEPRVVPRWLREPAVIGAIIGLAGTILTVIVTVWMSARRDAPLQASQPTFSAAKEAPQHDELPIPAQAGRPEEKKAPRPLTLAAILDVLERHHQRATFGAVAETLGRDPRSLFQGHSRSPRTAWVVNKATGLPTGTKEDYPPGLLQTQQVIDSPEALREWLRDHH